MRVSACVASTTLLAWFGSPDRLAAQVLYVPNHHDRTVSALVANTEAGTLTEALPRTSTPGAPTAVAAEPKGKFLYITSEGNPPNVAGFSINGATGVLSPLPNANYQLGGAPAGVCVDPSGKYLYVANQAGNVVGFSIDASTGALTRITGTPFAAGRTPFGVIVEPSGKYLYVANSGSDNVSGYAIDPASGALAALPGSPFAAGQGPSRLATDAAGKFLYVTNQASNNLSVYTINAASGALSAVAGSPFASGTGPTSVAAEPSGNFVYVANGDEASVSGYRVDAATGSLTPLPGSPFRTGRGPFGVALEPAGKFLYVPNLLSNNVSAYAIDPGEGALAPAAGSPFAAGRGPHRAAYVQLSPPVQPRLVAQAALNAASRAPAGLPNHGVAQGALFVVTGQNLGPVTPRKATEFPLAAQLGGTSVEVTAGGVRRSAPVVSTSASEVTAILPSSTPLGDGAVTVTYNHRTSSPVAIRVVSASFGIFTRNQAGSGAALALNDNGPDDQPENRLNEAARPGQKMVLLGTGLGAVAFDESQPPSRENLRNDVEVWVGNQRAEVSYSGRRPGSPGMDEIGFTIPADVTPGCYVPVAVKLGAPPVVSNFATVAIAAEGRDCSDPQGLPAAEMARIGSGETLHIGWIQLLRMHISASVPGLGSGTGLLDTGWANFFRWDAGQAASDPGVDLFTARGVSMGSCSVYTFRPGGPSWIPWRSRLLTGAPHLSLTGPGGSGRLVLKDPGQYEAHKALGAVAPPGITDGPLPQPLLEPGKITVDHGAGGRDVGSFQASLTLTAPPAPLQWSNFEDISASTIDRSRDLRITWTGGEAAGEYVVVGGGVILPGMMEKEIQVAAGFACAARAGAGEFTVPSAVLSALPASTPGEMSGFLMVGRAPLLSESHRFAAAGLDSGYLTFAESKGTFVVFR